MEANELRMVLILKAAIKQDEVDPADLEGFSDEEMKMYNSIREEIAENRRNGLTYAYDIPYDC